jgi:GNAT superfamily N-acetyltransferase
MATGLDALARHVRLDEDRVQEAATLLGASFQQDPLFVHACPDPHDRARWLPWMFIWPVWWGILRGEVLATAGRLEGIAIVVPSTAWSQGDDEVERAARQGRAERERGLSQSQVESMVRYDAALDFTVQPADAELHRVMSGSYLYLAVLGVKPGRQGMGIGSGLLQAVNARADASRLCSTLITYQPNNLDLYRRHGYDVVCTGTGPDGRLLWWGMRRGHDGDAIEAAQ